MPNVDRRSAMMMAGLSMAAVSLPTPTAGAEPAGPPGPAAPGPVPGAPPAPAAGVPPGFLGDEFDGPAGSPPNPALWQIAQRRELIKNPVFWDRPENMGQYRDDREHVFLDGNSNLVIRATREAPGKYVSGKVVGNFAAPINHTFEARVKMECLTPGAWPAWWVVNESKPRGGEVDLVEWYGNMEWPSGTTIHARLDGTEFATMPVPVDDAWHRWRMTWNTSGMYFWLDFQPGMEPYFEVPAFSLDDWAFNDPGFMMKPVFNVAIGGTGGKDAAPGNYPCQMLVDWVHIFPG
ncbi:MAG: glycoside hydrolase family 16 protein [Mycobacterium sp.]